METSLRWGAAILYSAILWLPAKADITNSPKIIEKIRDIKPEYSTSLPFKFLLRIFSKKAGSRTNMPVEREIISLDKSIKVLQDSFFPSNISFFSSCSGFVSEYDKSIKAYKVNIETIKRSVRINLFITDLSLLGKLITAPRRKWAIRTIY